MIRDESSAWRQALDTDTRPRATASAAREVRLPCLTVLYHPDLRRIGMRSVLLPTSTENVLRLSRAEPIFGDARSGFSCPLSDPFISRRPWELSPGGESWHLQRNQSSTEVKVDGEAVTEQLLIPAARLQQGVVLELASRVVLALHLATPVPRLADDDLGLIGESDSMAEVRSRIERLAVLDAPVLIRGESGTGKELVARALHRLGSRSGADLVTVNMAAVPTSLAAAELFGTRRGAFTGADRERRGFFRSADRGVLFLDEIGDTPLEVQPLLLRALESGEIQAVGAASAHQVDVRVIAATDLDLEEAIEKGKFRRALYHRLAACLITLPPLRQRLEDFGRLLRHFLVREMARVGAPERLELIRPDDPPWLPASHVGELARRPWPGNVRQLKNAVAQLVAENHDRLEAILPIAATSGPPTSGTTASDVPIATENPAPPAARKPSTISDPEIAETLRDCRWSLQPAARRLGISRSALYKRVAAQADLRLPRDLTTDELREAHQATGGDLEALVDRLQVSADALRRRLGELGLESKG